jgi:hypothetical protein
MLSFLLPSLQWLIHGETRATPGERMDGLARWYRCILINSSTLIPENWYPLF